MEVRPLKVGVEQTVRTYIRAFQVQNFGVHARHIYLPTEVFDLFTDYMEEQMEAQRLNQTVIEQITQYWYLGVEVHNTNGYDIIVTRDPLP